jgi:hypothetical protein
MSHSWLQRKRKGELIDLAQKAGLPKYATPECTRIMNHG